MSSKLQITINNQNIKPISLVNRSKCSSQPIVNFPSGRSNDSRGKYRPFALQRVGAIAICISYTTIATSSLSTLQKSGVGRSIREATEKRTAYKTPCHARMHAHTHTHYGTHAKFHRSRGHMQHKHTTARVNEHGRNSAFERIVNGRHRRRRRRSSSSSRG